VRAAEYGLKRRGVDNEDAQAGTGEDTYKIVGVADRVLAKGEGELGLDSKGVKALHNEDREVDKALRLS
jgi:hypothetical protein